MHSHESHMAPSIGLQVAAHCSEHGVSAVTTIAGGGGGGDATLAHKEQARHLQRSQWRALVHHDWHSATLASSECLEEHGVPSMPTSVRGGGCDIAGAEAMSPSTSTADIFLRGGGLFFFCHFLCIFLSEVRTD